MNSKTVVLLDTSIQIERMMGALAQQEALETHLTLKSHRFVSTQYVFMEFQRAVLADYVRVYHALLQHRNWEDAAYALRSGPLAYRTRALGRCLHNFDANNVLQFTAPGSRIRGASVANSI